MGTLLIRNLDDSIKETIRVRAAEHGRSMESEARAILEEGVAKSQRQEPREHPYWTIRRAVEKYGGIDLELPPRESARQPPDFMGDEYKAYD